MNETTQLLACQVFSLLLIKLFLLEIFSKQYKSNLSHLKLGFYNDGTTDGMFFFIIHPVFSMLICMLMDRNLTVLVGIIEAIFLLISVSIRHKYIYKTALIIDANRYMNKSSNLKAFIIKNILHVMVLQFCLYLYYFRHIQIPSKIY